MAKSSLIFLTSLVTLICVLQEHNTFGNHGCSQLPGVVCTPFKAAFSAELAKSSDLLNQFSVSVPPEKAAESFHSTIPLFTKLGASDPFAVAQDLVDVGSCKLNGITPNNYAALVAKLAERFLKNEGHLTDKNAESLAKSYVKFLNIARAQPYVDGSPFGNLLSIYDATTNLCLSFGSLSTKDADRLAHNIIVSYNKLPNLCE